MKSFWEDEKKILSCEKNKSEKIEVVYGKRQNKQFIDIRIHKMNKEGQYAATTKGVAIPLNHALNISKEIQEFCKKEKINSNIEDERQ